jgi:PadR family transcriptional regulator
VRVAKDLVAASATPMVLGILAEGESYGYAILRRINELSAGELDWTEGLLYPLLHRLERLGHVKSSWQSVAGERRRKYYRITNTGLAELAEQRRQWDTVVDALKVIWLGPEGSGGSGASGDSDGSSSPDEKTKQIRPFTVIALEGGA